MSILQPYFLLTQGYFREHKIKIQDQTFTVIIGARKSTKEGSVFPVNFGVNALGECANYICYELIVKNGDKSRWYTYSTSTPPLDVTIGPDNKVVTNCCDRKMLRVSEASVKWFLRRETGCNQWVLFRTQKEPDFGQFNRMIDSVVEEYQSPNIRMIDVDLTELQLFNQIKYFENSMLELAIHDSIRKQGLVDLSKHPEGIMSSSETLNGHTHASVFSFQYSNFAFHSAILASIAKIMIEDDSFQLNQVHFDQILDISKTLEHSLLFLYDRGKAKKLEPNQMGSFFNISIVSPSRNANTTFADKCLGSSKALNDTRTRAVFSKATEKMFDKIKTKISVISWNVAGFSPEDPSQIEGLLGCFDKDNLPDIISIGLQEVVELKSSNIARFFTNNSKENDDWVRCIEEVLAKLDPNYVKICYQRMVGLFSLTLVHKSFMKNIYNLGISEVKTGFMGIVGNKGSVITSLRVCDSLVHFCNTHLPSGDSVGKRASCVEDLYKEFCVQQKCDAFFLFGDLNLRVQMDLLIYKNMMEDFKLNNPDIDFPSLMSKDEVKLNLHPCLTDNFSEAPLPKAPTYRLVKNSDIFCEDRVASW